MVQFPHDDSFKPVILQELLISAKDEQFDAFIPCSERIVRAVTDMVVLFPEENNLDEGNSNPATRYGKAIKTGDMTPRTVL